MYRRGVRFCFGALLALVVSVGLAGNAGAAVPQGNLLVNGDAEAGPGETDTVSANCPPSWSCFGGIPAGFPNVTAVRYGTFGVAGTDAGAAIGGGLNFFAGGPATELDGMSQVVGLSGIASEIDTGLVQVTVSGFLGGFGSEDDDAFLNAYPRDTNAVQLLPVEAPLVSRFDRNDQTALLARSATGALPPGTRSILVRVLFRRQAGTYLDGYADNLSLTLSGGPNPPPSSPGSGGGPGGGGAQVDKTAAKVSLSGGGAQRIGAQRAVIVNVSADEAATLSASGTLSVPGASKVFKLRKTSATVDAGKSKKLKLTISRKTARAVKRALKKHRAVRANVTVIAVDGAGNKSTVKRKINARR